MLKTRIQTDQIAAMKARDSFSLNVLRYIVAQIKNREIEKREDLTDEEVVQVLRKQIKELRDAMETFEKGGRADLVEENRKQIDVLQQYMPAEISDDELRAEIEKLAAANADAIDANPKAIIGMAMKELKPKADPSRINAMLKNMGKM
jgi:uncharacterized protein YqeY